MSQISVLTVVLNNASGLRKTLLSVLNQSFCDFEYIIVDGKSTDGTVELLQACKDPRVKWISEPDNGIYDALKKGIDMASAEYITLIDSGNWYIGKDVLASMLSELHPGTDFLTFPYIHEKVQNKQRQWKVAYPDSNPEHLYFAFDMFFQGALVRRKLFAEYGLPNPKYKCSGDHAFVLGLYKNGVQLDTGKTVNYYFIDGGMSSDPRKIAFREDREIAIEFGKHKWIAWLVYLKRLFLFECLVLLRKMGLASAIRKLVGKSPDIPLEQIKELYCDPYFPWFERGDE